MKIKVIGIKKVVNDNPDMGKVMNGAHVHFWTIIKKVDRGMRKIG
ncbi:hypothetical protein [Ructibacterium gallinarum]|nr:hypothetical protein [Ructibacterium gallinarum]